MQPRAKYNYFPNRTVDDCSGPLWRIQEKSLPTSRLPPLYKTAIYDAKN